MSRKTCKARFCSINKSRGTKIKKRKSANPQGFALCFAKGFQNEILTPMIAVTSDPSQRLTMGEAQMLRLLLML